MTMLVVSFKMKDTVNAFADLRDDLHRIGQWCSNNLLLLNPSKTKLMVFGSSQTHSKLVTPSPLSWEESVPEHTSKDLGVILDTNRTYDEHITKTVSSCLSRISRTKHVFDKRSLLTILNALVFRKCFIVQTCGQIHKKVMYVDYKVFRTLLLELRHVRANMITLHQFYKSLNGYQ